MSTIIQIKRSTGVTAPATSALAEGELAYSQDRTNSGAGAILYIESVGSDGTTQVIDKIGGKYYTNTVDNFLVPETTTVGGKVQLKEGTNNGTNKIVVKAPDTISSDLTYTLPGSFSADQFLKVDGSGNLSFAAVAAGSFTIAGDTGTDTFTTGGTLTFTGTDAIDTAITDDVVTISAKDATSSQKGVVSFNSTNFTVTTGNVVINSVEASKVDITGATAVDPLADGDEFLVYDLSVTANRKVTAENIGDYIYAGVSGDITIGADGVAAIAANSVALGTDTTGNYVATVAGTANQITISGSGSETAAVTAALTDDVVLVGDLTVGGNDIKMSGGQSALIFSGTGDVAVTGDLTVTGNDIKMTGGQSALIFSGTGDVAVTGDLTVTGNDIKMSGGQAALAFSGTGDVAVTGDLTVTGNDIKSSSATALTLSGADVAVAGDLTVTGNDIKSSGGTTALTLDGANVTVAGNLTINGTSTIINSTTVTVDDSLLKLADGNVANSIDVGVYGQYQPSETPLYAGFFRDASDSNIFKFFVGLEAEPGTTVNTSGTGYTRATVNANFTGGTVSGLSSVIGVADGGTGAATFTSNGVLFGNTTSALQVTAAGTSGQVLQAGAEGVPVFGHIDGGTY
jgi:uncharacterized protein (DUF2141 family)